MSSQNFLRDIEKKAWLRTFEHGMWDISLGSLFVMFGLSILISFPALSAVWIAALMPSFMGIGHKLVTPRIGHVHFKKRRQRAKSTTTWILAIVAALGVVTMLFMMWLMQGDTPAWAQWIGEHFVIFIGLIWGGALIVTGWLVDFPRLYAYGVLMIGSLILTDLLPGYHLGISLALVGGLILLTGLILMIRFLNRYPKQDDVAERLTDD